MTFTLEQLNTAHDLMAICADEIFAKTGLKIRLSISLAPLSGIEPKTILPVVAQSLGMKMQDYDPHSRKAERVALRFLAVLFIRQYWPEMTYKQIAAIFGQDHSTIIHSQRTSADLLETGDKKFTTKYLTVKDAVEKWLKNYEKTEN